MNEATKPGPRRLIESLPAIYQEGDDPDQPSFLAMFLRAFEQVLFRKDQPSSQEREQSSRGASRGLEEEITTLPSLLDPMRTPEEFLPWLASWAALSFHPDLTEERRRKLLAHIIPLYRIRGTRKYIEELLSLAVDSFVSVTDTEIPGLRIESHSAVGTDTYLGGGPPYFFSVRLIAPGLDEQQKAVQTSIARSLIEYAKPAHTSYHLTLVSPRMQVGIQSTIGLNTVIGPAV